MGECRQVDACRVGWLASDSCSRHVMSYILKCQPLCYVILFWYPYIIAGRSISYIQGVFCDWHPPKIWRSSQHGKKLKYQNWYPPKSSKCRKDYKLVDWENFSSALGTFMGFLHSIRGVRKFKRLYSPKNIQNFLGGTSHKNTMYVSSLFCLCQNREAKSLEYFDLR